MIDTVVMRPAYTVDMPRDGRANRLAILRELARREQAHEPPPTLAELGAVIGLTVPGVQRHVRTLAHAGLVIRRRGVARWLVLTDAGRAYLE